MILIITDSPKEAFILKRFLISKILRTSVRLYKDAGSIQSGIYKKGFNILKNKIIIFTEHGRVITPISEKKRRFIENAGKKGQRLAKKARTVYLLRRASAGESIVFIKKIIKTGGKNIYEYE
ncbi:hypothetical protein [Johnsonella ignava]|uniref:hypothetical protein n=1 Tax=Johnsonella ignava TaxID=43995 RepID=UPI0023F1F67C|nr:hypothetical protein [Johnsonella ignava]